MADQQLATWQAKLLQVKWRRLAQHWLRDLPAWLVGALLLATAIIAARPFFDPDLAWWLPVAVCLPAGLVGSLVWAWRTRPQTVGAALALDAAFELQERVTTLVSLRPEDRATPAGQALLEDTVQRVASLNVAERFPLQLDRTAWTVPGAALAFVLLVLFYNPAPPSAQAAGPKPGDLKVETPVPVETQIVKQNNQERHRKAKEINSEKLEELVSQLDKITQQAEKTEAKAEKQQPVIQDATKLADDIKKRQEELGKSRTIGERLRQEDALKTPEDGPIKDLQDALSKGDFKTAQKEVQKLLQDLKDDKLSAEEKKKLAEQLKSLKDKLKDIAEQKKRKEELAKSDADPETKQKEMEKIEKESQALKDLAKLADKLDEKALEKLASGDPKEAQKAMEEAAEMLQQMDGAGEELQELAEMLGDLDKVKSALGDKDEGDGNGIPDPNGEGGQAGGKRPEKPSETGSKFTRVKGDVDPKGHLRLDNQRGPLQPKPDKDTIGKTTVELGTQVEEAKAEATEALRQQKVPSAQRDLVGEFYKNLTPQTPAAPKK